MNIIALIPARMNSSRFPGKPMANILGKPMIGHVYDRVSKSTELALTAVATCDQEIFDYIISIGGNAVMTSKNHERASDRCAEALIELESKNATRYDIIIMVQGDEPLTNPKMISQALKPFSEDPKTKVVNLLGSIKSSLEFEDRNCIKVVCDINSNAIYFSREAIPTRFISTNIPMGKQVCVISFGRDFLLEYTQMEQTPLEIAESIDMLRVIENGHKVKMVKTDFETQAVDNKEDLEKVEKIILSRNG
jgi:3-deoxy-manno-octulosonate cytidylyltransferase (CMP-KDO synthetase)